MSGIPSSFVVQANSAWQNTGISVPEQAGLTIAYEGGVWTADPGTNGGRPYDAGGCPNLNVPISQTAYPIPGAPMGALVGRIGATGAPFVVGDGPTTIPAGAGGPLYLCINDDLTGAYGAGLADNSGTVTVYLYAANTQPNLTAPLIVEPPQISPGVPDNLGPLKFLIGTWANVDLPGTSKGGPASPYSYNVMPLPQKDPSTPNGYILKNLTYYEELTFSAIHGGVANRDGTGNQNAGTLFYEQRVYFADGPNKDALVHAENGTLLYLTDQKQGLGPYGNGSLPGLGGRTVADSVPPGQAFNLVKQVAVPHGNSILALGNYTDNALQKGVPQIAPASPLPTGIDTSPYGTRSVGNPLPALTANPNLALTDALAARPSTSFLTLQLSTASGSGAVTNIGFERKNAEVVRYDFTYWLEAFGGAPDFTQLQYSQTITMRMNIGGTPVLFPHVTVNTLTKIR